MRGHAEHSALPLRASFISFLGSLKFPVTSLKIGLAGPYGPVARVTLEKVIVGRHGPLGIRVMKTATGQCPLSN